MKNMLEVVHGLKQSQFKKYKWI